MTGTGVGRAGASASRSSVDRAVRVRCLELLVHAACGFFPTPWSADDPGPRTVPRGAGRTRREPEHHGLGARRGQRFTRSGARPRSRASRTAAAPGSRGSTLRLTRGSPVGRDPRAISEPEEQAADALAAGTRGTRAIESSGIRRRRTRSRARSPGTAVPRRADRLVAAVERDIATSPGRPHVVDVARPGAGR